MSNVANIGKTYRHPEGRRHEDTHPPIFVETQTARTKTHTAIWNRGFVAGLTIGIGVAIFALPFVVWLVR